MKPSLPTALNSLFFLFSLLCIIQADDADWTTSYLSLSKCHLTYKHADPPSFIRCSYQTPDGTYNFHATWPLCS